MRVITCEVMRHDTTHRSQGNAPASKSASQPLRLDERTHLAERVAQVERILSTQRHAAVLQVAPE
jgi:hypothetical protein